MAEIEVKGGEGGDGAISFRREKYVPFGGPDGGNGGCGGDVVIKADPSVTNLRRFKHRKLFRAEDGGNGRGKKMHGKDGTDLVLAVPVGTVVSYRADGDIAYLADLETAGEHLVVARGGKGGCGNTHYVSSTNQAPHIAQKGESGEEKGLVLEMRLIADVGIIGQPNAGKSTLLAAASAARPRIADYPFTTLEPVLGVVWVGQDSFVLAEIPGLIEGAHLGRGLGHDFLRHVMRTKMIIHLIDGSSASPLEDMRRVNAELSLFDLALAQKRQLVVVNKIDLPGVQARLAEIADAFTRDGIKAIFISAATGEGVFELMSSTMKALSRLTAEPLPATRAPVKIFRPEPKSRGIAVRREGDTFVVSAPHLERITTKAGASENEARLQVRRRLTRLGVGKYLERAGAKPGDKVRCGELEWEL